MQTPGEQTSIHATSLSEWRPHLLSFEPPMLTTQRLIRFTGMG